MNEIEKLYELASFVKKRCKDYSCTVCEQYNDCEKYPPFTAEKQIELIKWIANRKGYPDYEYFGNLFDDYIQFREFDEALARLVNSLWQDLTEEQKQQVKGILE